MESKAPEKIYLKDVGVKQFCSLEWPPTRDYTFYRPGKGDGKIIPLYDCAGCPIFAENFDAEVYPVPENIGREFFK